MHSEQVTLHGSLSKGGVVYRQFDDSAVIVIIALSKPSKLKDCDLMVTINASTEYSKRRLALSIENIYVKLSGESNTVLLPPEKTHMDRYTEPFQEVEANLCFSFVDIDSEYLSSSKITVQLDSPVVLGEVAYSLGKIALGDLTSDSAEYFAGNW